MTLRDALVIPDALHSADAISIRFTGQKGSQSGIPQNFISFVIMLCIEDYSSYSNKVPVTARELDWTSCDHNRKVRVGIQTRRNGIHTFVIREPVDRYFQTYPVEPNLLAVTAMLIGKAAATAVLVE